MNQPIKLTQFSHGAGCGCKIAPDVLEKILASDRTLPTFEGLLVGNDSRDDAAVMDLGDGRAMISTTDFFMPIVDDPFDFGRIAATNAVSDIYAMGGTPSMAIAILGWPLDKIDVDVARLVVEGGRQACADAGIPLAGGHSIDAPEPIFGTAVSGLVAVDQIKRNDQARVGSTLYLSKPLGIGVLTTAEKQGKLKPEHQGLARDTMCQLNRIGTALAAIPAVSAMTDVTGFGLAGHLLELCQGSGLRAEIQLERIPRLPGVDQYIDDGAVPGGTGRNFRSYGQHLGALADSEQAVVCDPQTSGGLLVAADPDSEELLAAAAGASDATLVPIGQLLPNGPGPVVEFQ